MRISAIAIVMGLMLSPPLAMAQTDKPADSAATPPSAAPASAPSTAPAPAAPGTQEGTAKKSAISTPACSVKFLEAKVAGKLNGKKWTDFRRDVCGEHETTAVFPTAIAPKYESEKDPDKARTKTCADQFTANKATNANGGLKWVEKDGGYYSECISRLKEG
jgi:hypothetical protein